jgi:hypothetical protein
MRKSFYVNVVLRRVFHPIRGAIRKLRSIVFKELFMRKRVLAGR